MKRNVFVVEKRGEQKCSSGSSISLKTYIYVNAINKNKIVGII